MSFTQNINTLFGNAVRESNIMNSNDLHPVAKCSEQPDKAPLYVADTYVYSTEDKKKADLLEYFNLTDNKKYDKFANLEATCVSSKDKSIIELITLFKRSARLGDGRKFTYLNALEYYLCYNPKRINEMLILVGLLGSCKDYRVFANSSNNYLADTTVKFYLAFMTNVFGKEFNELMKFRQLFFKWMPLNNKASKTFFYKRIVELYYEYTNNEKLPKNQKSYRFACMQFRKFIVINRKTHEQIMSVGLSKIDNTPDGLKFLNSLPSGTRSKHSGMLKKKTKKTAFRAIDRHLPNSLEEWRRSLIRGDGLAKVNTAQGTVNSLTILNEYLTKYTQYLLINKGTMPVLTPEQELAFMDIVKNSQEITSKLDILPMVDLSGSMLSYNAINLALVMAMILSMRPKGHPLDGIWIAFSTNAEILNMGHCSKPMEWFSKFANKLAQNPGIMGYSTNFENALNNLIMFSKNNRIQIPNIGVVTDMRMDEFSNVNHFSKPDVVFTEYMLSTIKKYNDDFGYTNTPNVFVLNCSQTNNLLPMTLKFQNGAYFSCGSKGTHVSILQVLNAFNELSFYNALDNLCILTPWTTMLKTLYNFNKQLLDKYNINLLGDHQLLGEKYFL